MNAYSPNLLCILVFGGGSRVFSQSLSLVSWTERISKTNYLNRSLVVSVMRPPSSGVTFPTGTGTFTGPAASIENGSPAVIGVSNKYCFAPSGAVPSHVGYCVEVGWWTVNSEKGIDTALAQVRISEVGPRARTIIIPGNAPVSKVERKAQQVTTEVYHYPPGSVRMFNGYGVTADGGLHDRRHPNWEPRGELEGRA